MTGPSSPSSLPGVIWLEQEGDGPVLYLRGEIDSVAVEDYESKPSAEPADGAGERSETVMIAAVDARAVTFLNSVGITFLVRQTEVARDAGRRPVLREPSTSVMRVLEMTGVSALFDRR